jgi:hypothetical protein
MPKACAICGQGTPWAAISLIARLRVPGRSAGPRRASPGARPRGRRRVAPPSSSSSRAAARWGTNRVGTRVLEASPAGVRSYRRARGPRTSRRVGLEGAPAAGANPVVSAPLPACLHPGRSRRPGQRPGSFSFPAPAARRSRRDHERRQSGSGCWSPIARITSSIAAWTSGVRKAPGALRPGPRRPRGR